MNSSLKLFSVRGIDIRLHITFPLILVWAAFQFGFLTGGGLAGALFGVVAISLLFVLVTLHELGHSFAALNYGVPVKQIVLLPIGGVAQLSNMPEKPVQEFVIAIAGPAVNVALALIMGVLAWGLSIPITNPLAGSFNLSLASLFSFVFVYNIVLAVFNMIPAFPMDGGRVLRSLLAMRLDYRRATSIAASLGKGLAILFGLYGLFSGAIFTILIAIFIYSGAAQEARLVQFRGLLRGLTVQQAYSSRIGILNPYDNLQRAVNWKLSGIQSDFPVAEYGRYVGFVTNDGLFQALQTTGPATTAQQIMRRDVEPVSVRDELHTVRTKMDKAGVSALPVVENGRVVGIITRRHIQEIARMATLQPGLVSPARSA